jgi:hypothetical protein
MTPTSVCSWRPPAAPDAWADYAAQQWELFDTTTDPSECHDLAEAHPKKLQELINLWWVHAGMYDALPPENRNAVEIFGTERPQTSPASRSRTSLPMRSEHSPEIQQP